MHDETEGYSSLPSSGVTSPEGWAEPREPIFKRLWWWLTTGQARRPGSSFGYVLRERRAFERLLSAWRMMMGHRTMQPVPMLYLMVLVLGLVVGLVLQFTLGLAWYIAPLAFFALTWVFFFSTIWWGNRAGRGTLREDLIGQLFPEHGKRMRRERITRQFRESPLRFFAFAGESFPYSLFFFQDSNGTLESVAVRCVSPEQIERERLSGPDEALDDVCVVKVMSREALAAEEADEDAVPQRELAYLVEDFVEVSLEPGAWRPMTFDLDGRSVDGWSVSNERCIGAYCAFGEQWIIALYSPAPATERAPGPLQERIELCEITDRETLAAEAAG